MNFKILDFGMATIFKLAFYLYIYIYIIKLSLIGYYFLDQTKKQ